MCPVSRKGKKYKRLREKKVLEVLEQEEGKHRARQGQAIKDGRV